MSGTRVDGFVVDLHEGFVELTFLFQGDGALIEPSEARVLGIALVEAAGRAEADE